MGDSLTLDLSRLTFTDWTATDQIVLRGDADGEEITGTSQSDQMFGGLGGDTLNGRGGG